MASIGGFRRILRIDIEVLEQDCLRERGLVVNAGAPVAVTAGTDLEVEGAVYSEIMYETNEKLRKMPTISL